MVYMDFKSGNMRQWMQRFLLVLAGFYVVTSSAVTSLITDLLHNIGAALSTFGLGNFSAFFNTGGLAFLIVGIGLVIASFAWLFGGAGRK